MRNLGFTRFRLVGHDGGARVAKRLAPDPPGAVERLVGLDIIAALDFYARANILFMQDYFYFVYLAQPAPLPGRLTGGTACACMNAMLLSPARDAGIYDPQALAAYRSASTMPEAITGMRE